MVSIFPVGAFYIKINSLSNAYFKSKFYITRMPSGKFVNKLIRNSVFVIIA